MQVLPPLIPRPPCSRSHCPTEPRVAGRSREVEERGPGSDQAPVCACMCVCVCKRGQVCVAVGSATTLQPHYNGISTHLHQTPKTCSSSQAGFVREGEERERKASSKDGKNLTSCLVLSLERRVKCLSHCHTRNRDDERLQPQGKAYYQLHHPICRKVEGNVLSQTEGSAC